jgi:hypothetical protein
MTKANLKVAEESKLPSIDDEILAMQGIGAENVTANDIVIPRLTILQGLSPQVNKKKPEWIDGADSGDFCNIASGQLYKEEVTIIPCLFRTAYLEWAKGRGGFVRDHGDSPSVLDRCTRNEKWQYFLPNGNVLEETHQWYVLLRDGPEGSLWTPVYFPLVRTGLKHSRKLLTLCRPSHYIYNGKVFNPPLFWWSWRLLVVSSSNDAHDWHSFRPERGSMTIDLDPTLATARQCRAFHDAVRDKSVRPDVRADDTPQYEPQRAPEPINDGTAELDEPIPY